jgi:predicted RNA binding protein YcfA (HicA-like mRNA interferase family)
MSKVAKILNSVLSGTSDSNLPFSDLRSLLIKLGFNERVKGSHRIFWRIDIPEIINIQPVGSEAKAYQVKQVREIILRYHLAHGLDGTNE